MAHLYEHRSEEEKAQRVGENDGETDVIVVETWFYCDQQEVEEYTRHEP